MEEEVFVAVIQRECPERMTFADRHQHLALSVRVAFWIVLAWSVIHGASYVVTSVRRALARPRAIDCAAVLSASSPDSDASRRCRVALDEFNFSDVE